MPVPNTEEVPAIRAGGIYFQRRICCIGSGMLDKAAVPGALVKLP